MRRRIHVKVLLLVAATLVIALVLNTAFVLSQLETRIRAAHVDKLGVVAAELQRGLGAALDLGLGLHELPGVSDQSRGLVGTYPELAYVAVVDPAGRVVHSSADGGAGADRLSAFLAATTMVPIEAGGQAGLFDGVEVLDLSAPIARSAEAGRSVATMGTLRIGLKTDVSAAEVRGVWVRAVGVGLAVLVGAVVLVLLFVQIAITGPVSRLVETAERIAGGDLTQRAPEGGTDELALVGRAFNRMTEQLQALLRRIDDASAQVASASDSIAGSSRAVLGDAEAQAGSVEDTSRSAVKMNESVALILASIDRLTHASQSSSASVVEMGATIEEVATNMEYLAASVEQTTSTIEEVAAASREVAGSVERLTALASESASAIHSLESAILEVDENARETAALSEKVQTDAQAGMRAVDVTVAGIEKIRDAAAGASRVITGLGQRIRSIDSILAIIDDVAEETNLLALNAAIIAAQAGEHGRGFGVVADEIRDLAERTGASTKEIAEQVRQVQAEAQSAVQAMLAGDASIEEGVRLAREAGTVLAQIAASATRSVERVKGIARATAEQSQGSRQMTEAITQVAAMAQRISVATREQSKGGEQILQAVEKMREIAHQVKQTTDEQAKGGRHLTRAIEEMTEMIREINKATADHGHGSRLIEAAVERIKGTTRRNLGSAGDLTAVVSTLGREAKALRDEVRRFQL